MNTLKFVKRWDGPRNRPYLTISFYRPDSATAYVSENSASMAPLDIAYALRALCDKEDWLADKIDFTIELEIPERHWWAIDTETSVWRSVEDEDANLARALQAARENECYLFSTHPETLDQAAERLVLETERFVREGMGSDD